MQKSSAQLPDLLPVQANNSKHEHQESALKAWTGWILIIFAVTAAFVLIMAYGRWFPPINQFLHEKLSFREAAAWGQLGDFMGGILNPLISACTLVVAVMVWNLQKIELLETRKAVKEQGKTAEQQRREQRFFDLLNLYQETLKTFVIEGVTGKAALNNWPKLSPKSNGCVLFLSLGWIDQEQDKASSTGFDLSDPNLLVINSWYAFSPIFDHYFRTVFLILRELEDLLKDDHIRYGKLFRAQLSRDELTLLAFNLLFDEEGKKMRPRVAKYGLLKHLAQSKLRDHAITELDPKSFGSGWVKAQTVATPREELPC